MTDQIDPPRPPDQDPFRRPRHRVGEPGPDAASPAPPLTPTRHERPSPHPPMPSPTRHEVHPPRPTRHEQPPVLPVPRPRHGPPGPAPTRHEVLAPRAGLTPHPTRHEQQPPRGPVGHGAAAGGAPSMPLPGELRDRLGDVRTLVRSGQSESLRARDRATGREVFVKLYFETAAPDPDLMERLRGGDPRQVSTVLAFGQFVDPFYGRSRWWEVQAFHPGGTLTDLVARTAAGEADHLAHTVLRELTPALQHCHRDLELAHRDLKPDNIMVAGSDPVRLVLTDFGSARRGSVSRAFSSVQMTERYAAPEALNGHLGQQQDWWSLGMILLEILLGEHPYADLEYLSVRDRLTNYEVDVTGVTDTRWRLLLSGLLTRTREDRWGADEIERWLRGEQPEVRRSEGPDVQYPPLDVDGTAVRTPRELADFFLRDHDHAEDWLLREHVRLADWLSGDVGDTTWSVQPLRQPLAGPAEARRQIVSFVAQFAPHRTPPRVRGHAIDLEGLLVLVQNAEAGAGTIEGAALGEVLEYRLLGHAARHHCAGGHEPGCGSTGCARLRTLAQDRNVFAVQDNARELLAGWARRDDRGRGGGPTRDEIAHRAFARTMGYLLDPRRQDRDRALVLGGPEPSHAGWWVELRDQALHGRGPLDGAVALALAAVTRDLAVVEHQTEAARQAAEAQQEADRQAAARDRERERQRQARRDQRHAALRSTHRAVAGLSTPFLAGAVFLGVLEFLRLVAPKAHDDLYDWALADPTFFLAEFYRFWYEPFNTWLYLPPWGDLLGPLTSRSEPWAQHTVLVLGLGAGLVLLVRRAAGPAVATPARVLDMVAGAGAVLLCYLLLPEALGVVALVGGTIGGILAGIAAGLFGLWLLLAVLTS